MQDRSGSPFRYKKLDSVSFAPSKSPGPSTLASCSCGILGLADESQSADASTDQRSNGRRGKQQQQQRQQQQPQQQQLPLSYLEQTVMVEKASSNGVMSDSSTHSVAPMNVTQVPPVEPFPASQREIQPQGAMERVAAARKALKDASSTRGAAAGAGPGVGKQQGEVQEEELGFGDAAGRQGREVRRDGRNFSRSRSVGDSKSLSWPAGSNLPIVYIFLRGRRIETRLDCSSSDAILFGIENLQVTADTFVDLRRVPLEEQQNIRLPIEPPSPSQVSSHMKPSIGAGGAVADLLQEASKAAKGKGSERRLAAEAADEDLMLETWEISWRDPMLDGEVRRLRFDATLGGYNMVSAKVDEWQGNSVTKDQDLADIYAQLVLSEANMPDPDVSALEANLAREDPAQIRKPKKLLRNSSLPTLNQKWNIFKQKEGKKKHKKVQLS